MTSPVSRSNMNLSISRVSLSSSTTRIRRSRKRSLVASIGLFLSPTLIASYFAGLKRHSHIENGFVVLSCCFKMRRVCANVLLGLGQNGDFAVKTNTETEWLATPLHC